MAKMKITVMIPGEEPLTVEVEKKLVTGIKEYARISQCTVDKSWNHFLYLLTADVEKAVISSGGGSIGSIEIENHAGERCAHGLTFTDPGGRPLSGSSWEARVRAADRAAGHVRGRS